MCPPISKRPIGLSPWCSTEIGAIKWCAELFVALNCYVMYNLIVTVRFFMHGQILSVANTVRMHSLNSEVQFDLDLWGKVKFDISLGSIDVTIFTWPCLMNEGQFDKGKLCCDQTCVVVPPPGAFLHNCLWAKHCRITMAVPRFQVK